VPDFRAGAGGTIASEVVAKAPADGYTLLLTSATIVISPSLYAKLGYDPFLDFTPITQVATVPNVLIVHPSVPAKSLGELVKLAKTHPGKLNFGSGGLGSGSQLGSELFKTLTKIDIVHVPYKGAALALQAMLSGEVDGPRDDSSRQRRQDTGACGDGAEARNGIAQCADDCRSGDAGTGRHHVVRSLRAGGGEG
jgi:tripartite-type tricarboxylate transporter receptor subunit TctC